MENISENMVKKKYPLLLGLVIFAIVIYTILTFQWLLGLILLVITATFVIAFWYVDTTRLETEEQNEWVIIASAVIVAAMATAAAPWLAWAVAFVILFLLLHVLVRIERRLSMLEYRSTRRILRRRIRGGAGPRHRA
ncbi:MAG TPA: hypothetical protein VHN82_09350 [Methanoregula sp.]|nr:hypothetical protein [Methanoregula sp.]